jgi:hypothetical protein
MPRILGSVLSLMELAQKIILRTHLVSGDQAPLAFQAHREIDDSISSAAALRVT